MSSGYRTALGFGAPLGDLLTLTGSVERMPRRALRCPPRRRLARRAADDRVRLTRDEERRAPPAAWRDHGVAPFGPRGVDLAL
jgi:hypothetical protein